MIIKTFKQTHLEASTIGFKRRGKLKPISLSKSAGISYNASLQRIVRAVKLRISQNIAPLINRLETEYTTDSWDDDIANAFRGELDFWGGSQAGSHYDNVADSFIKAANQANKKQFSKMISVGLDVFGESQKMQTYLRASAADNARLIKSIPEQYLKEVQSLVVTNMRAGLPSKQIISQLQERYKVTQARARLIARDQTAKINSGLSERRQKESGFEYFQWIDSGDQRVRGRHRKIAETVTPYGKGVYRWDDPPTDDKGRKITPGSDYQCRCMAKPVPESEINK